MFISFEEEAPPTDDAADVVGDCCRGLTTNAVVGAPAAKATIAVNPKTFMMDAVLCVLQLTFCN